MPLEFKVTENPTVSECVVKGALLRIEETDRGYVATARRNTPATDKSAVMRTLGSHEDAAGFLEDVVNQTWF